MRRRRSGALDSYAVYDGKGKRLAGAVDRETAARIKDQAVQSGMRDVSMIRSGQDKEPGPRRVE